VEIVTVGTAEAYMHTGGGERGGVPHVPSKNIFEKLPHKNAIKHDTPLIFSHPQVPPQKNLPKKSLDFQLLRIYVLRPIMSLL
jgi:hypothetical protein